MNKRFHQYYERELRHLREMGGEYRNANKKVAGRIGMEELKCADPYVDRLMEATAFLAARVQFKIDAEFPRFTQHLLETVYPDYLCPTPSMAVVQFTPKPGEGALATGFKLPRHTLLRSLMGKDDHTACEYRTAHAVTLWPIELVEAQYHTQDLQALKIPKHNVPIPAAIRLRLRITLGGLTWSKLPLDSFQVFVQGAVNEHLHLYEQLIGHPTGVIVRPAIAPFGEQPILPASSMRRVGFEEDQALLPVSPRTFEGYRLLREYFAFPARFMFVEFAGLTPALKHCNQAEIDVIVLLRQRNLALENAISAKNFALFCTPAINLFPKRADRIHLSDQFSEHHVVPDRTLPLDFEVYQVNGVTGFGTGQDEETVFEPFYAARELDGSTAGAAYFATTRLARALSVKEKQQGGRTHYAGSEVYMSLVDTRGAPYSTDLKQLAVATLCTNRDLPLLMPLGQSTTDFNVDGGPPVKSVRCLAGPTPPKPTYAEGEFAWRIVSHLALNYLSLADTDSTQGAAALRDLLKLYVALATDPAQEAASAVFLRQVESLKAVRSAPIVRRAPTAGPIALLRGLEVTVTFDEGAFGGTGVFLLGAVLEWFFARYVSLNSFTETVVKTLDREEIMRWPTRLGRKPNF
jgi:type VI secretion system protein ImpG